jgi:glycosyltransferase involved in cell wall biosynthesis
MIVTDTGGLRETIGDRGTGIVADECTPECILKEILRFFSDEELREECIRNIRLEKERLSWNTFALKLEDFIKGL